MFIKNPQEKTDFKVGVGSENPTNLTETVDENSSVFRILSPRK
jgi:hypothetical protein